MALSLDKVHNYDRAEDSGKMVLLGKSPYSRFIREGETPVIVQKGAFWTDGGDKIPIRDVPKWVWLSLKKMAKESRESVGLKEDTEDLAKKADKAEAKSPNSTDTSGGPNLLDILQSLDHDDDGHWTKAGLPDLNMVKEKMGRYVSRSQVEEAIPGFRRKDE